VSKRRLWAWVAILLLWPVCTAVGDGRAARIVQAARLQIGQTVIYDPAYRTLHYPHGDVPIARGVCTDVVIRAFRQALDLDLQKLVHEDMLHHFSTYPALWGLDAPDRNIDHRRVPNLKAFFTRQGWSLPVSSRADRFRPGDLVTCTVPPHRPHIMVVSDRRSSDGVPWVIQNIGAGVREEDRLFEFPITGHYRLSIGEGG